MKRVGFIWLLLVFGLLNPSHIWAKNSKSVAVGYVTYVMLATTENAGLNLPVFPQTVNVSMLESLISNVEELQQRLERVYKYSNFTLLKTDKNLVLFTPGSKIFTGIDLKKPDFSINFELSEPVGNQVPVLLRVREREKEISRVSYLAPFGKTMITGFPLSVSDSDKNKALFVAVNYWGKTIMSGQDYPKIIDFFKRLNFFVPPESKDVRIVKSINHFFNVNYGVKKFIPLSRILPKSVLSKAKAFEVNLAKEGFVPYDVPPQPVGGFAALQKNLVYPEKARKKGIEGVVVLHVLIGKDGRVLQAKVLKSPNDELNSAAIRAIKKTLWKPALQKKNGKQIPVKVWVSIPVVFRLRK